MGLPVTPEQVEWQAIILDGMGAPYGYIGELDEIHQQVPADTQDTFTPWQYCKNQLVALYTWCDLDGRIYEPSNVPPLKDRIYPYAVVWCSSAMAAVFGGMGEVVGFWDVDAEVTIVLDFPSGGSSKRTFHGNLQALRDALAGVCDFTVRDDNDVLIGRVYESVTTGEIDNITAEGSRQIRHNGVALRIQFA